MVKGTTPSLRALGSLLLVASTWATGAAQPGADTPYRSGGDSAPGVSVFLPQRWGTIGVTVVNPTTRPVDLLSAHSFGGDTGVQFARQLWLPPAARRASWYPVLPSSGLERGMSLPVQSRLIERAPGPEVLLRRPGGQLIQEGRLASQPSDDPVTGVLAEPDDAQTPALAQLARAALRLSPRLASMDAERLPPVAQALGALDHLVIASDRLAETPASLRAIRRWLHAGGRAWVRLDRVSPATVALLLGEDFPCTEVGRIGLTQWQLRTERGAAEEAFASSEATRPGKDEDADGVEGRLDPFEAPVDMVRVLAPGLRPVHTIDGWPASFWRRAGRGGLLPMAAFLTKNAPGLRTSPVKRGYWVVRRVLGQKIPAPPANVPDLPTDEAKLGEVTLREVLARHRADRACAGCHERFDALGLAFEGYGPIGERRTHDLGGRPVDTSATFPGDVDGSGLDGLRRYFLQRWQDEFIDNVCRQLLAYGLGRTLLPSDDDLIDEMHRKLAAGDNRFSTIIDAIITSPQFLNKRVDAGRDRGTTR